MHTLVLHAFVLSFSSRFLEKPETGSFGKTGKNSEGVRSCYSRREATLTRWQGLMDVLLDAFGGQSIRRKAS